MIKLIAIIDQKYTVSINGKIPWKFPQDLKFFKKVTYGQVVIMGRNTWENLPKRPLEGRTNCIISSKLFIENFNNDVCVINSPLEAIKRFPNAWIIGGAKIYNYFLKENLVDICLFSIVKNLNNVQNYPSRCKAVINFDQSKFIHKRILYDDDDFSIIELSKNGEKIKF